ncbi:hypothetical protein BDA96_09G161300 [Sorghum bicolor]|jgi:uncharacterized protein (TIGR01568 family)|uniref:Transcription repressor n=2 Tax=Sorghum bicolor TaxID=4558 RepID=A0A921QA40_SORBI|nr:transcription repressor OFP8 [Sorghum bicolor]EES18304.1 hypothetical protein SORBI_3009G153900 [Sorghum bicolor]KAG0518269.1 hypothetical protein BDA96_09G161300 [Sorghum bicolor]|eukprot:XP_002439874.1 transcription repressor OFP8 [Sorghum bicolor]
MSLAGGGWSRRGGGGSRFEQPPPVVVVDVGCNCRAPRLLSSFISSLKSHARGVVGKPKSSPHVSSSSFWSSSATTGFTSSTSITTATTTLSSLDHHHPSCGPATYAANANVYEVDDDADHATRQRRRRRLRRRRRSTSTSTCGRAAALGEETAVAVAVEVESAAPYEDFRESMVAMVTEKEMYAWEDLNALLQQFLALNSPRHHPHILTAFADLWAPRGGPFCPPSPCL